MGSTFTARISSYDHCKTIRFDLRPTWVIGHNAPSALGPLETHGINCHSGRRNLLVEGISEIEKKPDQPAAPDYGSTWKVNWSSATWHLFGARRVADQPGRHWSVAITLAQHDFRATLCLHGLHEFQHREPFKTIRTPNPPAGNLPKGPAIFGKLFFNPGERNRGRKTYQEAIFPYPQISHKKVILKKKKC